MVEAYCVKDKMKVEMNNPEDHDEERQAGHTGHVPEVRQQGLPHRRLTVPDRRTEAPASSGASSIPAGRPVRGSLGNRGDHVRTDASEARGRRAIETSDLTVQSASGARPRVRAQEVCPMTTRVGINGFGRIGRQSLKAMHRADPRRRGRGRQRPRSTEMNALLFKHDSTYGAYPGPSSHTDSLDHRRRARDQGPRGEGPGRAAVGRPGRRHRRRVDGHLHRRREGRGATSTPAPRRSSSAPRPRARTSPIVLGVNEDRYDPATAPHHQQRQLHHELPGAGGQGRPRCLGIERGLMNTIHSLHQRPAHPRRRPQGPAPRPRRRSEHHPHDDRRGQGARARHPRAEGQVRRLQPARARRRR